MKIEEVNQSIIGRKVRGIFTALPVTGTIDKVTEDEYSVDVHIILDQPVRWGDTEFTEYWSGARKSDGFGNLKNTKFIEDLSWLKDYKPADDHFTSNEEMEMLTEKLNLENLTDEELQERRDDVVKYYHDLKVNEKDRNKAWDYTTAMMSVTAVIDHHKYNRGMEI